MNGSLALLLIPFFAGITILLFAMLLPAPKNRLGKRLEALRTRSLTPPVSRIASVVERTLGERQRGRIERGLQEAGWYRTGAAELVLRSAGGAAMGLAVAMVLASFARIPTSAVVLLFAILGTAGGYAPFWKLKNAIAKRKLEINHSLTDFLDLVATLVRAGLALNAALAHAVEATKGTLRDEMTAALSEIRLGRSRADALNAMSERMRQTDLSMAVQAIVQAEQLGAPIADALEKAADEARNYRLRRAEEEAAKLPIKLAFPLAFFMLPPIYVVIFTAAAAVSNFMGH